MRASRPVLLAGALLLAPPSLTQAQGAPAQRRPPDQVSVVLRVPGMERARAQRDVVFAADSVDGRPLALDVWRPAEARRGERLPVVVLVSGAQRVRTWRWFETLGQLAAANGLAAVVPDKRYPRGPDGLRTGTVDTERALAHVRANAAALGVDGERMCLWTFSAGGRLTAVGLRGDSRPRCLVAFYALLDASAELAGVADSAQRARELARLSPLHALRALDGAAPPTFIARAGRDAAVINDGIDRFVAEALRRNVPLEVVNYAAGDHGFDGVNDTEESRRILRAAIEFVKTNTGRTGEARAGEARAGEARAGEARASEAHGEVVPSTLAAHVPESTWVEHNRAAGAARQRGDWSEYRRQLEQVRRAIGDHPTTIVGLARASARLGDGDAAMAALGRYAAMGLALDVDAPDADSAWLPLRTRPDWAALAARLQPRESAGRATVAFTLGDSTAMAEGVAVDLRSGRTFVSSIRHGTIHVRDGIGQRLFVPPPSKGDWWSVLGLAPDPERGMLWASTAALPHFTARAAADSNRTALVAFDIFAGAPLARIELPPDGRRHVLGDISVLDDGAVVAADAEGGALYLLEPRKTSLRTLVAPGTLPSPQGSVKASDRRRIFVADYVKGIVTVDRRSGAVRPLAKPDTLALVGIDGLTRVGNELVAVQNGTRPQRVLRLTLDSAETRVEKWEVLAAGAPTLDEPTHVAITRAGEALVVANSGWNRYTDDGARRPDMPLEAPRVLRIPLP